MKRTLRFYRFKIYRCGKSKWCILNTITCLPLTLSVCLSITYTHVYTPHSAIDKLFTFPILVPWIRVSKLTKLKMICRCANIFTVCISCVIIYCGFTQSTCVKICCWTCCVHPCRKILIVKNSSEWTELCELKWMAKSVEVRSFGFWDTAPPNLCKVAMSALCACTDIRYIWHWHEFRLAENLNGQQFWLHFRVEHRRISNKSKRCTRKIDPCTSSSFGNVAKGCGFRGKECNAPKRDLPVAIAFFYSAFQLSPSLVRTWDVAFLFLCHFACKQCIALFDFPWNHCTVWKC